MGITRCVGQLDKWSGQLTFFNLLVLAVCIGLWLLENYWTNASEEVGVSLVDAVGVIVAIRFIVSVMAPAPAPAPEPAPTVGSKGYSSHSQKCASALLHFPTAGRVRYGQQERER